MNFDFSDEEKALKLEVRRFLEAHCPIAAVRGVLDAEAVSYDAALWQGIADQGWLGTAIPEAYGGLGFGYLVLSLIAEELGRSLAPVPFASTVYLFAEALMLAGSEEQKQALLPRIAAGDMIGCLAATERPGGIDASAFKTTMTDGRIEGVKMPVIDGAAAQMAVVLAREDSNESLFLVDLQKPGVSRCALRTLDPSRNAAELHFRGAVAERVGEPGDGRRILQAVLDRAAVLIGFEQLGGADKALEQAVDYAKTRQAFGRAIGSYQAIKHKLADIYTRNELARAHGYFGAWALSTEAPALPVAASATRVAASDAYWVASRENIQVHGGIGFTWEMDCHLHYRRARHLALAIGAPAHWKERLVSLVSSEAQSQQPAGGSLGL